jgi:hypothetical protein
MILMYMGRSCNQLIGKHNFEYIFWSVGGMELIGLPHTQLNLGFMVEVENC